MPSIRDLIVSALTLAVELPKLIRARARNTPSPAYRDEHAWVTLDRVTGAYVAEHCLYCKQARAVATRYCPGVAS